jgi:hypothetical protein
MPSEFAPGAAGWHFFAAGDAIRVTLRRDSRQNAGSIRGGAKTQAAGSAVGADSGSWWRESTMQSDDQVANTSLEEKP